MSFETLLENINSYDDIYIYGFGISGRWLSDNINKEVKNFIDTDEKKSGRSHNDISCISLKKAQELDLTKALIIISIIDIQDILPFENKLNVKKWLPLGIFLSENQATLINNTGESNEFLKYSLLAVEKCHKALLVNKNLYLRSIDIMISEKCSLKCKDCSNLMQYYEAPIDISFEEIKQDFEELTSKVEFVYEIRLIGGEPFMNKDIYKIIDYFNNNNKIYKQVVYTNATIPLKRDIVDVLKHPKVVFTLTDYRNVTSGNLARNTKRITDMLNDLEIPYRLHYPENWTDSGVLEDFSRSKKEMIEMFDDCCAKNLYTLSLSKIYRCPFAANADRLQGMPDDKKNYVSVNDSVGNIKKYLTEIDYIPACNYCKGRSYSAPEIEPAIQALKPLEYKRY